MISTILITVLAVMAINAALAIFLVIAEHFFANYGECTINNEKTLKVQGGRSLLASLGENQIYLPSACGGRGTCAYCKCKVTEGAGQLLPTELPLLTENERETSTRLSCQVKVKQDLKIQIPDELFRIKKFQAVVEKILTLTYDIKHVRLKLLDPTEITFTAGQYVQLNTNPYNGVKESVSRAYSIASPVTAKDYVDLMIRLVPEGICTTWVHQYLKEGDRVTLLGPMGDFGLRPGDGEMVLVAGGSGMAPMVSLLEDMKRNGEKRKITYFFGAVSLKDLFYVEEMKAFEKEIAGFLFVPALSKQDPNDNWTGATGLITEPLADHLKKIDAKSAQGYLCGSPGMINACIKVMTSNGIPMEQIYYDPFG